MPSDGAQFPGFKRGNEPQNLVDAPSHGQVLHDVRPDEPVRINDECPPQRSTKPLQQDSVILRNLLGEIGKKGVFQLPKFLIDPCKVGKLAVRADPEDLRTFNREFALPPGELEDLGVSYRGEVQWVEKQDDPLPRVIRQLNLLELLPHNP